MKGVDGKKEVTYVQDVGLLRSYSPSTGFSMSGLTPGRGNHKGLPLRGKVLRPGKDDWFVVGGVNRLCESLEAQRELRSDALDSSRGLGMVRERS